MPKRCPKPFTKETAVRKWTTWTCVALALCFVVGMLYAAETEKPKREGARTERPRVTGVVKAIAEDGTSITVTVKKEAAEKDETFAIVKEGQGATKVFVGRDAKTLADVKVGAEVTVVYKAADAGNMAAVIRMKGERREGKPPMEK